MCLIAPSNDNSILGFTLCIVLGFSDVSKKRTASIFSAPELVYVDPELTGFKGSNAHKRND